MNIKGYWLRALLRCRRGLGSVGARGDITSFKSVQFFVFEGIFSARGSVVVEIGQKSGTLGLGFRCGPPVSYPATSDLIF